MTCDWATSCTDDATHRAIQVTATDVRITWHVCDAHREEAAGFGYSTTPIEVREVTP